MEYTDRILSVELPANLPVAQPIRFDIAINLKNGQVLSNILQFIFDVGGIRALVPPCIIE
jgi:hypothetical protein